MQIFPVLEIDVNNKKGAATKAPSMHIKSIKTSVHDQQYFLTHNELISHKYKYIHKLTHYTTTSLRRLSHEHFIIACLAVTGLTRLTIKKNLELEVDDKNRPNSGGPGMLMQQKSGRKLLKKKSSFMVATNSLSESSEENILNEVKIELNSNRFTRLFSLSEVLNLDINSDVEPVKKPMKPPGSSFLVIRKDLSEGRMSSREDDETKPPTLSPPSTPPAKSPMAAKMSARSPSAGQYISPHLPTVEEQSEVKSEMPNRAMSFVMRRDEAVEDDEVGKDGDASCQMKEVSSPAQQNAHNLSNCLSLAASSDSQTSKTPSEALNMSVIVASPSLISRSIDEEKHHSGSSSPVHSGRLPGIDTSRSNSGKSGLGQLSFSKQHSSNSTNSSGPGHMSRGASDRSSNRSVGMPSLSMSKLRANSLRQISEVELAKSRKMAVNMIAQLLLDWLETRQDPIFNEHVVEKLGAVWKSHAKLYAPSSKMQSPHHGSQEEHSLHLHVHHQPRSRHGDQSREHSFNNRSLTNMHQPSDTFGKEATEHSMHLDPFNTSVKTDPSAELISDISKCIHGHLDK
ncbi:hypothetical protein EON65_03020 [archaeon]|nr:MAG: hypothetical protein EON65_03020 [archaeon]